MNKINHNLTQDQLRWIDNVFKLLEGQKIDILNSVDSLKFKENFGKFLVEKSEENF